MSDEVTAFLRQGGLEAYARILVEEGFDTMDRLALMDDRNVSGASKVERMLVAPGDVPGATKRRLQLSG